MRALWIDLLLSKVVQSVKCFDHLSFDQLYFIQLPSVVSIKCHTHVHGTILWTTSSQISRRYLSLEIHPVKSLQNASISNQRYFGHWLSHCHRADRHCDPLITGQATADCLLGGAMCRLTPAVRRPTAKPAATVKPQQIQLYYLVLLRYSLLPSRPPWLWVLRHRMSDCSFTQHGVSK